MMHRFASSCSPQKITFFTNLESSDVLIPVLTFPILSSNSSSNYIYKKTIFNNYYFKLFIFLFAFFFLSGMHGKTSYLQLLMSISISRCLTACIIWGFWNIQKKTMLKTVIQGTLFNASTFLFFVYNFFFLSEGLNYLKKETDQGKRGSWSTCLGSVVYI